jgi:hypothetical protein
MYAQDAKWARAHGTERDKWRCSKEYVTYSQLALI